MFSVLPASTKGRIVTEAPCHPLTLSYSSSPLLSAPLFPPACSHWASCWPSWSALAPGCHYHSSSHPTTIHVGLMHIKYELTGPFSLSRPLGLSRHLVPYTMGPGSVGGRSELWGHALAQFLQLLWHSNPPCVGCLGGRRASDPCT